MLIALGILIWILCGLLSVYLGGIIDRITGTRVSNGGVFFFFLTAIGPVALITVICVLISEVSTNSGYKSPLMKIYNLGRGDEKN